MFITTARHFMIWLLLQVISSCTGSGLFCQWDSPFLYSLYCRYVDFLGFVQCQTYPYLRTFSPIPSFHPFLLPRMFSLLVGIRAHVCTPASSFLFPLLSHFFPPPLCELVDSYLLIGFSPWTFRASTCNSPSLCTLCPVTNLNLTFLRMTLLSSSLFIFQAAMFLWDVAANYRNDALVFRPSVSSLPHFRHVSYLLKNLWHLLVEDHLESAWFEKKYIKIKLGSQWEF